MEVRSEVNAISVETSAEQSTYISWHDVAQSRLFSALYTVAIIHVLY